MDDPMGCVLCARTQIEHRQNLGARVDRQPEPEHLCGAAQPGSQFIQLQVCQPQMAEGTLVHGLRMRASTSQPSGNGGSSIAKDPFSRGSIQSFSQRGQHDGDLLGRGFQTIQGSMTPRAERGAAGRASKGLDRFSVTMSAVANEGMNVSVGNPEVQTLLIGTGEAFSVYAFGSASPAFDLTPGPPREWRWTRTS
jgi:hypothetical protein